MSNLNEKETDGFQDRVVAINRVAKVVKGGMRFSFSALVVGKAGEVPDAIKKASDQAKKNLITVAHIKGTLPFEVDGSFSASTVRMYPAKSGKGIIAGGAVRTLVELSGVQDIVCKVHGSKNPHNVVRATMNGLKQLLSIENYAKSRGIPPEELQQLRHTTEENNSDQ